MSVVVAAAAAATSAAAFKVKYDAQGLEAKRVACMF